MNKTGSSGDIGGGRNVKTQNNQEEVIDQNNQEDQNEEEVIEKVDDKVVDQEVKPRRKRRKKQRKLMGSEWTTVKKKEAKWANLKMPEPEHQKIDDWEGSWVSHGEPIPTHEPPMDPTPPNRCVILKNLPQEGVTTRDLKKFFGKCGDIKHIKILTYPDNKCKGIAFIDFYTVASATKAVCLDKFWYEDRNVYVDYSRGQTRRPLPTNNENQ